MTKAIIAKQLALSFATVSKGCDELFQAGFVKLTDSGVSTGGRKPAHVEFVNNARYVVGLDLSCTNSVKASLLNLDYEVVADNSVDIPPHPSPEALLDTIGDSIKGLLKRKRIPLKRVLGAGVAIPGLFDQRTQTVFDCNIDGLNNVYLKKRLQARWPFIINICNDANMVALGQSIHAENQSRFLLTLYFTDGIGLGIIIEGKVYEGLNGFAGELDNSLVQYRGKQQRLVDVATCHAILKEFNPKLSDHKISHNTNQLSAAFVRAFQKEDKQAQAIIEHCGQVLGDVLADLVNVLNPEQSLLGGNLGPLFDILLPVIRQRVRDVSTIAQRTDLRIDTIDSIDRAIIKGCGETVFQQWLTESTEDIINS